MLNLISLKCLTVKMGIIATMFIFIVMGVGKSSKYWIHAFHLHRSPLSVFAANEFVTRSTGIPFIIIIIIIVVVVVVVVVNVTYRARIRIH